MTPSQPPTFEGVWTPGTNEDVRDLCLAHLFLHVVQSNICASLQLRHYIPPQDASQRGGGYINYFVCSLILLPEIFDSVLCSYYYLSTLIPTTAHDMLKF